MIWELFESEESQESYGPKYGPDIKSSLFALFS